MFMRKIMEYASLRESRLLSLRLESMGGGDTMEPLEGFQRTRESSIGAVQNVLGGLRQTITGKNWDGEKKSRIGGVAGVGRGVLDAFDIPVSLGADAIRNVAGTPTKPHSPSKYNITRALKSVDIRTDDPVNAIKDTVVYVSDNVHALLFKPGSDALKAIQNMN